MGRKIDFSKPLSPEEAQYVADRPWMADEARTAGLTIKYAKSASAPAKQDAPDEDDVDDEADEQESEETEEVDYEDLTVKQLQAEIDARNEDRDPDGDEYIVPDGTKKADLIAALEMDDEANEADED